MNKHKMVNIKPSSSHANDQSEDETSEEEDDDLEE